MRDFSAVIAHPTARNTRDAGVINAMRHICTCDDRALFAFRMPDSSLKILGDITERYLLLQLGHKLRTLDFYKSIKM